MATVDILARAHQRFPGDFTTQRKMLRGALCRDHDPTKESDPCKKTDPNHNHHPYLQDCTSMTQPDDDSDAKTTIGPKPIPSHVRETSPQAVHVMEWLDDLFSLKTGMVSDYLWDFVFNVNDILSEHGVKGLTDSEAWRRQSQSREPIKLADGKTVTRVTCIGGSDSNDDSSIAA